MFWTWKIVFYKNRRKDTYFKTCDIINVVTVNSVLSLNITSTLITCSLKVYIFLHSVNSFCVSWKQKISFICDKLHCFWSNWTLIINMYLFQNSIMTSRVLCSAFDEKKMVWLCWPLILFTLIDPSDERKVIVKRLALCVTDRPDMELDLTGDLTQLKKQVSV